MFATHPPDNEAIGQGVGNQFVVRLVNVIRARIERVRDEELPRVDIQSIFGFPVKWNCASIAVPIADPESLATGGTKTSVKSPLAFHLVFQSQFSPHPPAMTSGNLFFKLNVAN